MRVFWPQKFYPPKETLATQPACNIVCEKYMQVAIDCAAKASASGFGGIAAALVDPTSNQVLAVASRTDRHPLRHPVMQCIEQFANKLVEVEGNPTTKRRRIDGDATSSKVAATSTRVATKSAVASARELNRQEQYLCSGFDLYTTVEPCTMSVHSYE